MEPNRAHFPREHAKPFSLPVDFPEGGVGLVHIPLGVVAVEGLALGLLPTQATRYFLENRAPTTQTAAPERSVRHFSENL